MWKMLLLLLMISLTSCGKSKVCDSTTETCAEDYYSMSVGDDCESFGEGSWILTSYKGQEVAARCDEGILGRNKKDRLRCLRDDYEAQISSDEKYVFCRDSAGRYSFLYDQVFGAHKPWRCDSSASQDYFGVDTQGRTVELECDGGLLVKVSAANSGTEAFDPETGVPSSCSASSSTTVLFEGFKLEDFDPTIEVVETFDPKDACKAPVDPSATKPDNISGSFFRG